MNKRHTIYQTWYDMKNRCLNLNDIGYYTYGGRGIRVCDRWLDSTKVKSGIRSYATQGFLNFMEDMGPTWFEGATIDRIDNDGDYSLENCQWLTREQNSRKAHINKPESLESRIKMSKAHLGVKDSKETKMKKSMALAGKKKTDIHRFNLSKSLTGRILSNEHRENLSRAQKGNQNARNNTTARGTIWITDGKVNKRVPKDSIIQPSFSKGMTIHEKHLCRRY